jgi:hypothetical protein
VPPAHFDLCIGLGVAEYLSPQAPRRFVKNLCSLADIILFSDAVPGQGGTNHINERWPSYWAGLFEAYGFEPLDIIRSIIWHDERIEWWCRQNMLLLVNESGQQRVKGTNGGTQRLLAIIHPEAFYSARVGVLIARFGG